MRISQTFAADTPQIERLIREHPLAQVVSMGPDGLMATPLPLLLRRDGEAPWLLGHFARANPQVKALEASPDALAIFNGPHGYVSPSWFRDRSQAPTWNFATVHFSVRIRLIDSPEAASEAVEALTDAMEAGHARPWRAHELGERYRRMTAAVVAFRADVTAMRAKFKLGQNESPEVFADTLAGLEAAGQQALARMMREVAEARGVPA